MSDKQQEQPFDNDCSDYYVRDDEYLKRLLQDFFYAENSKETIEIGMKMWQRLNDRYQQLEQQLGRKFDRQRERIQQQSLQEQQRFQQESAKCIQVQQELQGSRQQFQLRLEQERKQSETELEKQRQCQSGHHQLNERQWEEHRQQLLKAIEEEKQAGKKQQKKHAKDMKTVMQYEHEMENQLRQTLQQERETLEEANELRTEEQEPSISQEMERKLRHHRDQLKQQKQDHKSEVEHLSRLIEQGRHRFARQRVEQQEKEAEEERERRAEQDEEAKRESKRREDLRMQNLVLERERQINIGNQIAIKDQKAIEYQKETDRLVLEVKERRERVKQEQLDKELAERLQYEDDKRQWEEKMRRKRENVERQRMRDEHRDQSHFQCFINGIYSLFRPDDDRSGVAKGSGQMGANVRPGAALGWHSEKPN